jgi:LysR family transcriptional regulator, hca operon transcriptional activator
MRPACRADPACGARFAIEVTGRLEKDFVSWAHACETWEVEMELRHLRYFIGVADAGSLTVAAEQKLNTSQPSLSRQIRDLEQEVGVQLMNRGAQGIELTSAGKAFLDHARMALLQAEAAKEAALRAAQPPRPTFALGFLSGAEIDLLPEVNRVLRDEFPGIEIRLSSDYSPVLAKSLMRRKLDAAFMRPEEHMEDLAYRRVRTDPLVFVFPSDHRLASQAAVAPQEIVRETFYLPSKAAPAVRRVVLEYFNRAGVDLKPEHEVHNVVHAISMITSTRGVMMLPAYTKRYLPESITTRPVKGEVPTLDLVLAYHKANNSPILKLLLSRVGKLVGAS